MVAEERLGDDETQHGVAEELLAFVVRDSAVLVRERAMGQGTTKQRLIDVRTRDLTEFSGQIADGPLRSVSRRPLRAFLAHGLASEAGQAWCSVRSAAP